MSYQRHNHIAQEIYLINEEKKLNSEHAKMITIITQLLRHLENLRKEIGNHPGGDPSSGTSHHSSRKGDRTQTQEKRDN